jgi:hypothetical protein
MDVLNEPIRLNDEARQTQGQDPLHTCRTRASDARGRGVRQMEEAVERCRQ